MHVAFTEHYISAFTYWNPLKSTSSAVTSLFKPDCTCLWRNWARKDNGWTSSPRFYSFDLFHSFDLSGSIKLMNFGPLNLANSLTMFLVIVQSSYFYHLSGFTKWD